MKNHARVLLGLVLTVASTTIAQPSTNEIRIVELQGTVEVSPPGASNWVLTQTNQVLGPFYRMRTQANSRVALRWSDKTVIPFGALTELEILPPDNPQAESGLHFIKGILSFFHRDQPGRIRVITRGSVAGIEGTEFVLSVESAEGSELTTISVIDGKVRVAQAGNPEAFVLVTNGQQAIVQEGKAPVRTAGFVANNL